MYSQFMMHGQKNIKLLSEVQICVCFCVTKCLALPLNTVAVNIVGSVLLHVTGSLYE